MCSPRLLAVRRVSVELKHTPLYVGGCLCYKSPANDQPPNVPPAAVADEENKDEDPLLVAVLDAADQESPRTPDMPCTARFVPCLKDEPPATMPLWSEAPEGRRVLHIWSGSGADLESVWTAVCRRYF